MSARRLVFLTESNRIDAVTIVDPSDPDSWTLATLAGDGAAGFLDGAAETAEFRAPSGLAYDANTLYVADSGNHAIRAIDLATNVVTTIAGTPASFGFGGDGGPATLAALFSPQGIAMCNGDLFVSDTGNHRVRRIDTAGNISTVAGTGVQGRGADCVAATSSALNYPAALAVGGGVCWTDDATAAGAAGGACWRVRSAALGSTGAAAPGGGFALPLPCLLGERRHHDRG